MPKIINFEDYIVQKRVRSYNEVDCFIPIFDVTKSHLFTEDSDVQETLAVVNEVFEEFSYILLDFEKIDIVVIDCLKALFFSLFEKYGKKRVLDKIFFINLDEEYLKDFSKFLSLLETNEQKSI